MTLVDILNKIFNRMVNQLFPTLDKIFAALADPTRRAILSRLSQGAATVNELATPFSISLPAISKHLRVLEDAGLLRKERQGRYNYCHLNAAPLKEATSWLMNYEQFWEGQFDALANYLKTVDEEEI